MGYVPKSAPSDLPKQGRLIGRPIKMWSAGAFTSGKGPISKVNGPAFAGPLVPIGHQKLSSDTPPSAKAVNRARLGLWDLLFQSGDSSSRRPRWSCQCPRMITSFRRNGFAARLHRRAIFDPAFTSGG